MLKNTASLQFNPILKAEIIIAQEKNYVNVYG